MKLAERSSINAAMTELSPRMHRRHEDWLRELGILGEPWLILGGAPNPVLPPELLEHHARIDINNSGLTAANLGLGPADITFRRAKAKWAAWPEFNTRGLIWFTRTPTPLLRFRLLTKHRKARVERLMRMPKADRTELVESFVGREIRAVGDQGKPSNGIVAICYGLAFGAPEVVIAGVSLSRSGHSYDKLGRPRKQVAEDTYALERLASDPRLSTTEPELADAMGLRLWRPPIAADPAKGPVVAEPSRS